MGYQRKKYHELCSWYCFILCSWYCFILCSWYCFLWYPMWDVLYCVLGIVFSGIPCGMFYTVFVVLFSLVSRVEWFILCSWYCFLWYIPHGILEKAIPRTQHKTSHTGCQRKQYHEHSIKHPTRYTKQNNTDAKKRVP
jgi:hypothetical protein